MVRIFVIIIFLCYSIYSLKAQNSIMGQVMDCKNKGLPYVNICLLKDSSNILKITSDSIGCFCLNKVVPGNYLLSFSMLGYRTKNVSVTMNDVDINLPITILENDDVMLETVTIKASSFIRQKDKLLIIPNQRQIKHANSGYDLLYNLMIPGVDVDRKSGKVLNISGDILLYINGEPADYRDVQSLRPRDIEKVEYYDVPTGKYVGDNGSINYIVKKYRSGGYVFAAGKQNIGYLAGDYNIGAKLSHDNTSYSVWGGHSMQKYDGTNTNKNETILFPDYSIYRNRTTMGGTYRNNQQYFQFKVNNSTKKRNLSAQVALVRNETPSNGSDELLDYSGHYTRSVHSSDGKNEKSLSPSVRLYGDFNLGKNQTLEFTVRGSYTHNNYARLYTEDYKNSSTDVSEDLYLFSMDSKYRVTLKHHNSLGVNLCHYHKITSSVYMGDYDSWQHLWTGETMLRFTYNHRLNSKFNLNFSPGISLVNYKLHTEKLRRYWSLRTNIMLTYWIDKQHKLIFGLGTANDNPEISYINNVDQTVDFLQIKRGNPFLDHTKYFHFSLIYDGAIGPFYLGGAMTYNINKDNISPSYYVEKEWLINSFTSNVNLCIGSVQLFGMYRILDDLRMKLAFRYYHTKAYRDYNIKENTFVGTFDVNYFIKDYGLNFFVKSPSKQLDSFSLAIKKNPATYGASVSWSHKGWYLEAGTENPFTKHARYKEHADYGVYKYNQIQTSRINQQTGYVKVAYTFDFGRKTSRDKNDVDRSINSAIMKVD